MFQIILRTTALLALMTSAAYASNQKWNVTEEGKGGVKSSQGTWTVAVDSSSNVTGKADLQSDKGGIVSYTINGSLKDAVYTINLADRTDGKKGCVWSGRSVTHDGASSRGLIGEVNCESGSGFIIRAGF